jgi:hypothetical protein
MPGRSERGMRLREIEERGRESGTVDGGLEGEVCKVGVREG